MAEKQALLTEAAEALRRMDEKQTVRDAELGRALEVERGRREQAERAADLAHQQQTAAMPGKQISDESKLLYAEAFGSFDLEVEREERIRNENQSVVVRDLEEKNSEMMLKLTEQERNIEDSNLKVEEFKWNYEKILRDNEKLQSELLEIKDAVVGYRIELSEKEKALNDCNNCNENLTSQLKEKNEEFTRLVAQQEDFSTVEGKDEEIASLQAELALLSDQAARLEAAETELTQYRGCNNKLGLVQQEVDRLQDELVIKNAAVLRLETELAAALEGDSSPAAGWEEMNNQIRELRAELAKRNAEIIGFVVTMKSIKDSMALRGSPLTNFGINSDVFDINEETEELSWDHGFEEIIEPTKQFIEKLVDENLEKSKILNDHNLEDKNSHIAYLEERCEDLENILAEKQQLIAEVQNKLVNDRTNVSELSEMQTYLNSKLVEIRNLNSELAEAKETDTKKNEQLQKAMTAIQGFVTENFKLSQALKSMKEEGHQEIFEENKRLEAVIEEINAEREKIRERNEQLIEEAEQLRMKVEQAVGRAGAEEARDQFRTKLTECRAKFDTVLLAWRSGRRAAGLMRDRLEQLADFLQQLLDSDPADTTDLNLSNLVCADFRQSLQRSIDESRLLSASLAAGDCSALAELSMLGLEPEQEQEIEALAREDWRLLCLQTTQLPETGDTVPKQDYDNLLLELRDNLRKRREVEEVLARLQAERKEVEEVAASGRASRLPVAVAGRGSRSGSRRRRTLTRIPGPATQQPQERDEEDCWSEPDKVESRARMGLEGRESTGPASRETDDESGGLELGTELRRERGRADRLRSELSAALVTENNLQLQVNEKEKEIQRCKAKLVKKEKEVQEIKEVVAKMETRTEQLEGENEKLMEVLSRTKNINTAESKEKVDLVQKIENSNETAKMLNEKVIALELECKLAQESHSQLSSEVINKNLELERLAKGLGRYEAKCKQMIEQHRSLTDDLTAWKGEAELKRTLSLQYEENITALNRDIQMWERNFEELKKEYDVMASNKLNLEEHIRSKESRRKSLEKSSAVKDKNLKTAESLIKELNSAKQGMKKDLEIVYQKLNERTVELSTVTNLFDTYRKDYNDEIIQNKTNEVENKIKSQADGLNRLSEQLLIIDQKASGLEQEKQDLLSKLQTKSQLVLSSGQQVQKLSSSLDDEKFKNDELGKTIENMRNNIRKLETEKLIKDSLEIEFDSLKKELAAEKSAQKVLNEKIVVLKTSKRSAEERCISAEKVLRSLTELENPGGKENTRAGRGSRLEVEAALQTSRRPSLSSVSLNTSSADTLPAPLCSELEQVRLERDAALAKLAATRATLVNTAEKLSASNKRKKAVEKAICKELTKTHRVLEKTKTNLENVGVEKL